MTRLFACALLASLVAAPALAQTNPGRFAVGAQVGTTGVGVEGQFQVSDRVTVRAGADLFRYDEEFDTGDIGYDGEIDFTTAGAFVDLHPFGNALFVSAGGYAGERSVKVTGTPRRDVVIAGQIFPPARFGRLVGEADFGGFAPFVGLGYNNTFRTDGRIGFKILAGAAFGEEPTVDLRREGGDALTPAVQAQFDADTAVEERRLEQELGNFKTLPVVQLGLSYRF